MPAPAAPPSSRAERRRRADAGDGQAKRRRRRGGRGRGGGGGGGGQGQTPGPAGPRRRRRRAARRSPVQAVLPTGGLDLDDDILEARRGRERKGRPVGRYLMCVHVDPKATQIAVLEGRNLIEHYVSRPSDDVAQIHGNIYLGRVQNVLPGHGGGLRRHRHPEERRALPRRRALRRRRRGGRPRASTQQPPHRADAQGQADDHLPGHQEPDRRQGRPPHPGGVAARAVRGADPEQLHLRHLEAAVRRRAQAAPRDPRPGQAEAARRDRAHRRRGRHRPGDRAGRPPAARPVGPDRRAGQAVAGRRRSCTASPTWPSGSSARSSTATTAASSSTTRRCSSRSATTWRRSARSWPTASSCSTGTRSRCRCSSGSTSTSSSTRRSTARCGCRRAAR